LNDNSTQLDHMMAALSAAEQIVAVSPVTPTNFSLIAAPLEDGPFSLNLYFHYRRADVEAFGATFGAAVSESARSDGAPHVEAAGEAFGHSFRAWWLGEPTPQVTVVPLAEALGSAA
jgi:hypothetical protein